MLIATGVLLFLSAPAFGDAREVYSGLQARKADVVERSKFPRLRARASVSACSTNVRDADGNCCTTGATTSTNMCCPAAETYSMACANAASCCETGTLYSRTGSGAPDSCCPSGNVYTTDANGDEDCCPSGSSVVSAGAGKTYSSCCPAASVYTDSATKVQQCCSGGQVTPDKMSCCTSSQTVVGNTCQAASQPTKRSVSLATGEAISQNIICEDHDPVQGTSMTKRVGSHRTVLSAKLMVDYLLNDGVFHHNGEEHVDLEHQSSNKNLYNKAFGFGLSSIARYTAQPWAIAAASTWGNQEFYAFAPQYEFRPSEIPEIYARLMGNSSFEHFFYNGLRFDRSLVHDILSRYNDIDLNLVEKFRT